MKKKYLLLAATLLEMASETYYSNHGCNDWSYPPDWTEEDRRAFGEIYSEYNNHGVADQEEDEAAYRVHWLNGGQ